MLCNGMFRTELVKKISVLTKLLLFSFKKLDQVLLSAVHKRKRLTPSSDYHWDFDVQIYINPRTTELFEGLI